jgi:hypothetical protein
MMMMMMSGADGMKLSMEYKPRRQLTFPLHNFVSRADNRKHAEKSALKPVVDKP